MSAYVREAIYRNFKLNERKRRYMCISNLYTCLNFCATKDSTPCNSTLINLLSARDRLRIKREERAIYCWTAASAPKRTGRKAVRADRGKGR